jgi:hypothetical protein
VRAGKAEGGTSGIQGGSIYPTYSHAFHTGNFLKKINPLVEISVS